MSYFQEKKAIVLPMANSTDATVDPKVGRLTDNTSLRATSTSMRIIGDPKTGPFRHPMEVLSEVLFAVWLTGDENSLDSHP